MLDLTNWGAADQASAELTRDQAFENAMAGIDRLRIALEEQDAGLGNFLNSINTQLRQFPELAHLLPDDQISVVVAAHLKGKLDYLTAKSAPKPKKPKAGAANLLEGGTVSDLL